jgi:hypothetical protein
MSQPNNLKEIRILYNPRVVTNILFGVLLGGLLTFSIHAFSAWSPPTATAPGNNTASPITVEAVTQTKNARLNVTQLGDANDGNYYLDPNSVSYLNDIRPNIIYDRNNTGYYADLNNWSNVNALQGNDIRSNIFYDRYNTYYYLQP